MSVFNIAISVVTFRAVHDTLLHALNNTYMVGQAVALPIVEDQVAGIRSVVSVPQLIVLPEPLHIGDHVQLLRQHARVQATALVGASTHKDRTPFQTVGDNRTIRSF